MATRYKTVDISVSGTQEVLVDALAGLGERKRLIKALWAGFRTPANGGSNSADGNLRAVREQEEMVDFNLLAFVSETTDGSSNTDMAHQSVLHRIPTDIPLERGMGFKVGMGPTSLGNVSIILEYENLD